MRNVLRATVLAAGVLSTGTARGDMSLDVSPIRVHVRMSAGDEYTNSIRVLNPGKDPVRLHAYLEDWSLDEEGTPLFHPAGTQPRTATVWVDAAPSDFLLEPGQTKYVRFTVSVPPGITEGGYHAALLLESLPLDRSETRMTRMFIQGRVATMLYITIGNPRRSAAITALTPVKHDGKRLMRLTVSNTGDDFLRLAGMLELVEPNRDKRPVGPLPDVPVLPGTRRTVELDLPADVTERLLARVTLDLAGIGVLVGETPLGPTNVLLVR
jgi:P pilus assembly chaperone PapD